MHYYLEHTPNYFHLYGWLNDIRLFLYFIVTNLICYALILLFIALYGVLLRATIVNEGSAVNEK